MATSFAAYASQYLNRQPPGGSTSLASSQPMFFSFSTDDGSRAGHGASTDLDDADDPHLRQSAGRPHAGYDSGEEDDDPYLRLDEDGPGAQSIPLIASPPGSVSSGSPKGWLAHLAASPSPMPLRAPRSPSPTSSQSSSSDDSSPPPDLFAGPSAVPPPPRHTQHPSPHSQPPRSQHKQQHYRAPPPPPPVSLSLTESLLPRDGLSRPLDVFSLPDPRHLPRSRRKHHDAPWVALWLFGVSLCVFFSILLLFVATPPPGPGRVPYMTFLHTVPLLVILTFAAATAAYVHIWLLQVFVGPVMVATEVFVPATLFVCAVWAFVGSFMWEEGVEPTWGESVGLRIFSLLPLLLSLLTARRLYSLPTRLHTTSSTLTLTTHLLTLHPLLLLLSPAILLLALLASIPFLTLIFRLLLVGYTNKPDASTGRVEWHLHGWANWALAASVGVWMWSWGVARGVVRVVVAGVVGAWYFADPSLPPPPPTSTHTPLSALTRATGPSLGTIALAALLLTLLRILFLISVFLHRLPFYLARFGLPAAPVVLGALRTAAGYVESAGQALSGNALVYAGLTGDGFWRSAGRARALAGAKGTRSAEAPLSLLTIAPLTLTFPFALGTYLFVAHTLGSPQQALGTAMLAGGVTAVVGLFCVGVVKDTADTLYMCYCIDKDVGERRREEVFAIFEYDVRRAPHPPSNPSQSPLPPPVTQPQPRRAEPELIVPLSPAQPQPRGPVQGYPEWRQQQQQHPDPRQQQWHPDLRQQQQHPDPRNQHQRTPSHPTAHQRTPSNPQHYPEPRQPLPSHATAPILSPAPAQEEDDTDPFLHGLGLGSEVVEEADAEREANRKAPQERSGDSDSEEDSVAGDGDGGDGSGGYFPGSGFF